MPLRKMVGGESEYSRISYIYGLFSTEDTIIRYIGYTINPKDRLKDHIKESKRLLYYRHKWIQKVIKDGFNVEMKIFKCVPSEICGQEEMKIIKHFKELGNKLVNGNDGGIGGNNPSPEVREKIRLSKLGNQYSKGKKLTPEIIANMKRIHTGKIVSQETRDKLSKAFKGRTSPNLKLRIISDEDIITIFKLFNEDKLTCKEIGIKLGYNKSTINNILYRDIYYKEVKSKYKLILIKKK